MSEIFINKNTMNKLSRMEATLGMVVKAGRKLEDGLSRQKLFPSALPLLSDLYQETYFRNPIAPSVYAGKISRVLESAKKESLIPGYSEDAKKGRDIILPSQIEGRIIDEARSAIREGQLRDKHILRAMGGSIEIVNNAHNAQQIVKKLKCAVEEDRSKLDFEELEKQDKKGSVIRMIVNVVGAAATAVAAAAIPVLYNNQLLRGVANPGSVSKFYLGFGMIVAGISVAIWSFFQRQNILKKTMPRAHELRQSVQQITDGLDELDENLNGVIEAAG